LLVLQSVVLSSVISSCVYIGHINILNPIIKQTLGHTQPLYCKATGFAYIKLQQAGPSGYAV